MGGVYPEKEAGPQGPAGVRMSGRQGHLQRRLRRLARRGRGLQEEGGVHCAPGYRGFRPREQEPTQWRRTDESQVRPWS